MPSKSDRPLLSVVIPTRNRQECATWSVESILRIQDPDLEVVVQDNSDSRSLADYLRHAISDSRLRYNYNSAPVSFIDNFDAAIRLASGKYLCIIGDDDGVNPEIMEATRWAELNDVDALTPTVSVSYLWPKSGIPSTRFTVVSSNGVLTIRPFSGRITKIDPEVELKKHVRNGGCRYLSTEIPRLYHGVVKRECLDRIRDRTGAFFGGLSPDVFAAVSVANVAENVVSIDYPLTIAGASRRSGSVSSSTRRHVGNLEEAPHFRHRGAYKWATLVPRFYCVQTIWADTTIAALEAFGREDLLRKFNLPVLAAYCIASHFRFRYLILHHLYSWFRAEEKPLWLGVSQFCYSLLIGPCWLLLKRVLNRARIMLLGDKAIRIENVQNIAEANHELSRILRERGVGNIEDHLQ